MMKINFKVRFKNPVFIIQLIMAIFTPILAYAGLTVQDLTTWKAIGDLIVSAFSNPYVIGLVCISVWNAINDPTTKGICDSVNALTYDKPKSSDIVEIKLKED